MDAGMEARAGPAPRARVAPDRGNGQDELARLRELAGERHLSPHELERMADAAYAAGNLETAISAREQIHADCVASGDLRTAARAATGVAMYLMMDTGLMAPVRAWARRAERLLDGQPEAPVHAWLAMTRAYERLLSGDLSQADDWARRAIAVGERQGEPSPATLAGIAHARLQIFDGQVAEGLALLDDAAVTIMSGAIDPLVVGMAYCELICAMQGLAQYDRAEQWTHAMERWSHDAAVGGINGRCRIHRAEILRLRGSCRAAEEEASGACDELRPWMRREFGWPLTELGTIRLRRGDLKGAEQAFLDAHAHGWDPQPGLALLRLTQGDVGQAAALIDDALERPMNAPSKERPPNSALRRAPLLEAQTEICLAAGDAGTARMAADELRSTAERFLSLALTASAELARGRVMLAEGDAATAARRAGAAVAAWSEVGAPYETAMARLVVAASLERCGSDRAARTERDRAHEALDRIGARPHGTGIIGPPAAAAAAEIDRPAARLSTPPHVFRVDGDTRTIRFDGTSVLLRDLKGMRYLARLLSQPGRELHALDLLHTEEGTDPAGSPLRGAAPSFTEGGLGPTLDATARRAYERRLGEIEEDIEEATRLNDIDRVALATADRDYLVSELARAVGLGGRSRPSGSPSERARTSVTRTLRYAMDRISAHHPRLGRHLAQTVRTGTYCSYVPDPRHTERWLT